jgi:membrane protein implicated in regulation of membrane protease activity
MFDGSGESRRRGSAYDRIGMPSASAAQLTRSSPFPDELGEPVWQERRAFPVVTLGAAPLTFLAIAAIAVGPVAVHVVLAAATILAAWLLYRARDRAVLETYTVSDRFIAVEQPRGGRVAIATEDLTGVTVAGDKVRLASRDGVVTLGFVRRQRGLLRALERVAPGLRVEHDADAFCPT